MFAALFVLNLVSSVLQPTDWLATASQNWPILCRVRWRYLTQSINMPKHLAKNHYASKGIWELDQQEAFEKCRAHSPLRAVLHCHSPGVATAATVARRLHIDVHDDDDNNNNDNAWQRGPLWPHGMGPIINLACWWCTVAAAGWPVSHPCTDRFCQSTSGDVTHSWWRGTAGQKPAGFQTCEVILTDYDTAAVGHHSFAATCSNDILQ